MHCDEPNQNELGSQPMNQGGPQTLSDLTGRYAWHVETDQPTTESGVFMGDYVSVSAEGVLYIWGPRREVNHMFESGTWRCVFPKVEIHPEPDAYGFHQGVEMGPGDVEPPVNVERGMSQGGFDD